MRGRLGAVAVAIGILAPFIVACGQKAAPSPSHTVSKASRKAPNPQNSRQNRAHSSSGSASVLPAGNIADGAKIYASTCQVCHGARGVGTASGPRLAAPSSVVSLYHTKTQLQAFIAHNMPASNPGSLTPSQAANAGAYVWHIAGGK